MTKHNKLKASLTVEAAFVLPFVFLNLIGVLVLIVIMFQNTIQMSILNARALSAANSYSGFFYRNDRGFLVDEHGDDIHPYDLLRTARSIYNLDNPDDTRNLDNMNERIQIAAQGNLDTAEVLVFDREAFAVTTEYGNSVIIRARLTTFQNRLIGLDGDSFSLFQTAIAPVINPSQYIRQTDAVTAMLAVRTSAYYEVYWGHPNMSLRNFLEDFYLDLFEIGTY